MIDSQMTDTRLQTGGRNGLEMRWVPVTDERGRTQMQAVWIDVTAAQTASSAA